jgi:Ribbon-helix-helix protein, copG family
MHTNKETREHLTHRTHLLLPPSMAESLEKRAIREGVSMAALIRQAIRRQLEK